MINLMPDETKRQLRAARTNILLVRYLFILLIAFGFLSFSVAGSYYLLTQTKNSAQQLIDASDTEAEVYETTQQKVATLTSQLTEARTILDQETSYAATLTNIGQLIPEGAIIEGVTLDISSFNGTPVTMEVYAKSANIAIAVREAFQQSSFFSSVNLQSVSENDTTFADYPVTATMTVTANRTIAQ